MEAITRKIRDNDAAIDAKTERQLMDVAKD